jgi:hypothetical protein
VTSLQIWETQEPAEQNEYCLFPLSVESDSRVFFHATPLRLKEPILEKGFRSANTLGVGQLQSVSFAKKSSACLAHLGCRVDEDYVLFAVRLNTMRGVRDNLSDIHLYDESNQPETIGYSVLNAGFRIL